jgi:hypothetical protein
MFFLARTVIRFARKHYRARSAKMVTSAAFPQRAKITGKHMVLSRRRNVGRAAPACVRLDRIARALYLFVTVF